MRDLHIATAASFFETPANQVFSWPALVNLLQQYDVGEETLAQYNALSKNDQLRAKDHGWFNGNTYSSAERLTECITGVDLLTFDIDNGKPDIARIILSHVDPVLADDGCAYFLGSTRKHTAEKPRLRLVLPLARTATVDEADALKRMLAFRIGMASFDPVSFRANQIMFWPSRCIDGPVVVQHADGPWLDPDVLLARWYPNGWERRERWPLHPAEDRAALTHARKKAADPTEKPGLIGAWCRLYTIEDAMTKFLPGVYAPGSTEGRYTHMGGTTADGAIVYDGKWLYSHHQTDPGSGRLLNAWDLVRVHRFGQLDAKVQPDVPVNRLPSSRAMEGFARTDREFVAALGEDATIEFKNLDESTARAVSDLTGQLSFDRAGQVQATHANIGLILRQHPTLAGALAYNHNTDTKCWRRFMPWHDATRRARRMDPVDGLPFQDIDTIRMRDWMLSKFRMELPPLGRIDEVVALVADENGFHPIRDHIAALPEWDGVPRLDSLLVRYLNADDTPYTRAAARKFLIGAIKRAMEPGCKFDTMLLLIGPQRIRKSAFLEALCGRPAWFSDELPKLGKEAVEHIRSLWFVEVAELAQFNRTDIEFIKAFLSRRHDRARLAYEANSRFFPRQTVFAGTTNNYKPLKDTTGNGRYWPIICRGFASELVMIDVEALNEERDQVMAEARAAWAAGEPAHLTDHAAIAGARAAQADAMPEDPIIEAIDMWLDGEAPSKRSPSSSAANEWQDRPTFRLQTCVRQIACEALGFSDDGTDWPGWLSNRIVEHLHELPAWGPSKGTLRIKGYGKPRAFVRFGNATSPEAERAPAPARAAIDL